MFSGGAEYSVDTLGDVFGSWNSQFNYGEIASANDLILLFPQQITSYNGCYEYKGFTGDDYLTKFGAQAVTIKGMIDRLI